MLVDRLGSTADHLEKASAGVEENDIQRSLQDKLANPAFTQKVPASVLAEHQQRLIDWQAKEKQTQAAIDNLPKG